MAHKATPSKYSMNTMMEPMKTTVDSTHRVSSGSSCFLLVSQVTAKLEQEKKSGVPGLESEMEGGKVSTRSTPESWRGPQKRRS